MSNYYTQRYYQVDVTVNEEDPLADQPAVCRNMHLYTFQLQSLYKMKSIEANPVAKIEDIVNEDGYEFEDVVEVNSRVGILANKPGSGKSAVVLSLCAEPCITRNELRVEKHNGFSAFVFARSLIKPVSVKANLIVTNPKLLLQWAGYMKNFSYSHYTITNITKVPKSLEEMIELCQINQVIFITSSGLKNISQYASKIQFERIFFDEIDSMEFPSGTSVDIHANFIWWVTATPSQFIALQKNKRKTENKYGPCDFKEYIQSATNFRYDFCRKHFAVKCADALIDACIALPQYTIENLIIPKSAALRLTQGIFDDSHIQNLLRGDRIDQVINLLNVTGQTVSTLAEAATSWMDTNIKNLKLEIVFVEQRVPTSQDQADRQQRKIKELLIDIERNEHKKSLLLTRISESTDCMICCDYLNNPIATKCCAQAFCASCMKSWIAVRRTCPNCRSSINEHNNFITKPESEEIIPSKKRKANDISTTSSTPRTKLEGLLHALEPSMKSLLYTESTEDGNGVRLTEALTNKGYEVVSLFGRTSAGCRKIIDRFRESPTKMCLIVNSIQHSAGFNLQFVDTIVMYQRMGDRETQIIGRGMRPGRTVPLKVYRILYDNE